MKNEKIYSELAALAEHLGLDIREERGDFTGGLCRIDGKDIIFLNKTNHISLNNEILAQSLAQKDYNKLYILPAVREFIENHRRLSLTQPNSQEEQNFPAPDTK